MNVRMSDAAVVCLGEPTGYPLPMNVTPIVSEGVSSVLWDNLWYGRIRCATLPLRHFHARCTDDEDFIAVCVCVCVFGRGTNYIMWYPFSNTSSPMPVNSDPDLLFRYTLSFQ